MEQIRAGVLSSEWGNGLSLGGDQRTHRRLRCFPSHTGYPEAEYGSFTKDQSSSSFWSRSYVRIVTSSGVRHPQNC